MKLVLHMLLKLITFPVVAYLHNYKQEQAIIINENIIDTETSRI